mgnify:CR=1 FL=1
MILDRVTITGADNSTSIRDLLDLSQAFPFVEWGILLSATQEGAPRFPSEPHLDRVVAAAHTDGLQLSLHVCGRWVRQMLAGANPVQERYPGLWEIAPRVQLNFHGMPHEYNPLEFLDLLRVSLDKQFIFQLDGVNEAIFRGMLACGRTVAPLFDTSAGAGKLPEAWPKADTGALYHGYAGGLGPETLP